MDKKERVLKKTWVVCLLAMICCLLWGSAFPCVKVGYRLFGIGGVDTAAQILFAGIRFTLAGVLVIVIGSLMSGKFLRPDRAALPKIGKVCLLQTVVQYIFFYVGLAHTTGVRGAIVEASNVDMRFNLFGDGFVFISAFAYALSSVLIKRYSESENPVSKVTVFGFSNPVFGVLLSALVLGEGSAFGWRGAIALVLVSVGIFVVNFNGNVDREMV